MNFRIYMTILLSFRVGYYPLNALEFDKWEFSDIVSDYFGTYENCVVKFHLIYLIAQVLLG